MFSVTSGKTDFHKYHIGLLFLRASRNKCFILLKNNKGQAAVEFAFMLLFYAVILIFLITIYGFINSIITTQHDIRYNLRKRVERQAPQAFTLLNETKTARHNIPEGIMQKLLNTSSIDLELELKAYSGCWWAVKNKNKFRHPVNPPRYKIGQMID